MGAACCGSTKQLKRKPAGSNNPSSEAINRAMAFEKRKRADPFGCGTLFSPLLNLTCA